MTKRILLTGAGGFVGSHVIDHFLETTDWEIIGLDSFRHKGCSLRLQHVLPHPRVRIIGHDLTAPLAARWASELGEIDTILHVASESHVDRSVSDPVPFVTNNVALQLSILEFARLVKPRLFIQCSTDEVFGPARPGEYHSEDDRFVPSNPYSASKAAQDCLAISYWRTYRVPLITTMCMNMFGPRQDPEKFLPLCISRIARGEQITLYGDKPEDGSRMYLHVRNLCDAWRFIIENCEARPFAYQSEKTEQDLMVPLRLNVTATEEVTNYDLMWMIANNMGKQPWFTFKSFDKVRPGYDQRYALDGSRIRALGWEPIISFENGLRSMIEWTLKHPVWMK